MEYQNVSQVYASPPTNSNTKKVKYQKLSDAYSAAPSPAVNPRNCEFAPFNGTDTYFLVTEGYGKCQ